MRRIILARTSQKPSFFRAFPLLRFSWIMQRENARAVAAGRAAVAPVGARILQKTDWSAAL